MSSLTKHCSHLRPFTPERQEHWPVVLLHSEPVDPEALQSHTTERREGGRKVRERGKKEGREGKEGGREVGRKRGKEGEGGKLVDHISKLILFTLAILTSSIAKKTTGTSLTLIPRAVVGALQTLPSGHVT